MARDVLDVLGLGDTAQALKNTGQNCVCAFKIPGQRGRPHKLINEAGLYRLILRSDKKEAKPFQKWVTEVVLPTIRRDGSYVLGEEKMGLRRMKKGLPPSIGNLFPRSSFSLSLSLSLILHPQPINLELLHVDLHPRRTTLLRCPPSPG